MKDIPVRVAAIRMALLLLLVGGLEIAVVVLSKQPLMWTRWIPALILLLGPLTIWEVLFQSESKQK